MSSKTDFHIRYLRNNDISLVTKWARNEGFSPGTEDVFIYRHTDRQGVWVGCLNEHPIGCIAGVRYNEDYGFIGLFIVSKKYRGNGYGIQLWKHALEHLQNLSCIGLEAAPDRIKDYSLWGFKPSSKTTRWQMNTSVQNSFLNKIENYSYKDFLLTIHEGSSIPNKAVQEYDAKREPTPRPHFLSDWLTNTSGNVLALLDQYGSCHGFGRIRPCLLTDGLGWRIGPLLADSPKLAEILLIKLIASHSGIILVDSPGLNPSADVIFESLGFTSISETYRMYKGDQPTVPMDDVYGLACLELG